MLEVVGMLKLNQISSIHEETVMEEAHIVLMEENEIVVDPDLLESIAGKLDTLGKPNETDNSTIFRVSYKFHQSMENLFEPSVVSIGPFHRGKTSVQTMAEEQKLGFLRDFLSHGDHISLNLCLSEIKKLEERTRRCYSESVPLDSNNFVEMMLLDGCFVLEYLLKWYVRSINTIGQSLLILSDLLLLENQIPFFIVEKLFEIHLKPDARIQSRRGFIDDLAQIFAEDAALVPNSLFEIPPPDEIHQLVHLRYHSLIPINPRKPVVSSSESFFPSMLSRIKNLLLDIPLWVLTRIFPKIHSLSLPFQNYTQTSMVFSIPCATELENAGIRLRPKRNPCHMLDIAFHHRLLEIPTLIIHNESQTLLANLVAFEQCKLDKMSANLSSFALLLDSLVNTPEDVMILQQCGIIKNHLDSDKELIDFFNQICKVMVVMESHFLAELFVEVNRYCQSSWGQRRARWNRHKKQFIKDYFSSPWTAISLVAGVFVVLFTCVQTVFAVLDYFVPRS